MAIIVKTGMKKLRLKFALIALLKKICGETNANLATRTELKQNVF